MFKCCVCNKSPRKGKSDGDLSKTRQDGKKKAVSPILTNSTSKIEESRTPRSEDKLNGDVQKSRVEKVPFASEDRVENSLNGSENRDDDVWKLRKVSSVDVKRESKSTEIGADEVKVNENEPKEEDKNEESEIKNIENIENMENVENVENIEILKNTNKEDDETVANKTEEVVPDDIHENQINEDSNCCQDNELDTARDELSVEDQRNIINTTSSAIVKTNIYDASAYIERTIDDGPDEEGDDSVFESCPNENEENKKAPGILAS